MLVSLHQAVARVLRTVKPLPQENVFLDAALGCVLAETVSALRDLPPWPNSAMDGFAVRSIDTRSNSRRRVRRFQIVGEVRAGVRPDCVVGPMQACRIMTGAILPAGSDAVVPVEATGSVTPESVAIEASVALGENVRNQGEELRRGGTVMSPGHLIGPAEIGLLAAAGRAMVRVIRRPRIGIVATGDELVSPGTALEPHQVWDSNSSALGAAVALAGAVPVLCGIARDDLKDLQAKIALGLGMDGLLISGGVSVGKYDLVRPAIRVLGGRIRFWQVAIKPGRPFAFGSIGGQPVFGLPGNPVSSLVTFEQLVRPALLRLAGHRNLYRLVIDAVLKHEFEKQSSLTHFVRVSLSTVKGVRYVEPTGDQGSHRLTSLTQGGALMIVPAAVRRLRAGSRVRVQLLDRVLTSQPELGFEA